ncbi:MAG: ras-related protein [Candidatus Improbicoccus pseudotrichonymphae]|uniref:Ras-related protein n=1 Tax=Candidatus Improbicoccus pseudotrichonymphae TaxID=3033792 RepID=A0AA48I1J5_9FIRM|nr:MAG: ras-related protein [Candidatus Improbicoccus pseudotrichonymphae]
MKKENSIDDNKNNKKINKSNKIISSVLAVIMCCQSFVGAGPPLNTDNTVGIVESSISKNENENENGLKGSEDDNENSNVKEDGSDNNKKSKGILEKIKDNYVGLAVSGLGLVVLCAAGFALWLRKLNDKNPHNVEEPKVNPSKIVVNDGGIIKVVLVGGQKVGKTGFFNVLCGEIFNKDYKPTIGVDIKLKVNRVEGKEIKLQIWDTMGQERFHSILPIYFKNAQTVCVCFDLTEVGKGTIGGYLASWVEKAREHCPKDVKFMFIGCKNDLYKRKNDSEIKDAISSLKDCEIIKPLDSDDLFFRTSAASKEGIQEFLDTIMDYVEVVTPV